MLHLDTVNGFLRIFQTLQRCPVVVTDHDVAPNTGIDSHSLVVVVLEAVDDPCSNIARGFKACSECHTIGGGSCSAVHIGCRVIVHLESSDETSARAIGQPT